MQSLCYISGKLCANLALIFLVIIDDIRFLLDTASFIAVILYKRLKKVIS